MADCHRSRSHCRNNSKSRGHVKRRDCAIVAPSCLNHNACGPARPRIAREGYDPVYGARPLKRFLQRELETRIGRQLVAGSLPDGSTITIALEKGALAITPDNPQ